MKKDKKPDSVVYKPEKGYVAGLLEYGTSIGGPPIVLPDLSSKGKRLTDLSKHFQDRLNLLTLEYNKILEDWKTNQRLWSAKLRMEPKPGEIYHLYVDKNNEEFLSIISPEEWGKNMNYQGTYIMHMDGKWDKVENL